MKLYELFQILIALTHSHRLKQMFGVSVLRFGEWEFTDSSSTTTTNLHRFQPSNYTWEYDSSSSSSKWNNDPAWLQQEGIFSIEQHNRHAAPPISSSMIARLGSNDINDSDPNPNQSADLTITPHATTTTTTTTSSSSSYMTGNDDSFDYIDIDT